MHIRRKAIERHTLAVIVDNEPGILARIAGLFTARGYNIESLTVSESPRTSRSAGSPSSPRPART